MPEGSHAYTPDKKLESQILGPFFTFLSNSQCFGDFCEQRRHLVQNWDEQYVHAPSSWEGQSKGQEIEAAIKLQDTTIENIAMETAIQNLENKGTFEKIEKDSKLHIKETSNRIKAKHAAKNALKAKVPTVDALHSAHCDSTILHGSRYNALYT